MFKSPCCNAEFEEDDWAYLAETGECQYCHYLLAKSYQEVLDLYKEAT